MNTKSKRYQVMFEKLVVYLSGFSNIFAEFKRSDFANEYPSVKQYALNPFFSVLRKRKKCLKKSNPNRNDGLHQVVKGSYLHQQILQRQGVTYTKEG